MLFNPFTPSEIASDPNDFFGRGEELRVLERSIRQGSVVIQGPVGIGKSSLLSRIRLHMEGFQSDHKSKSIIVVGNSNIENIDQAAHLLLSALISVDEQHNKVALKIGPVFEFESSEIIHNFKDGRHLAVLKRLLEAEYMDRITSDGEFLILAIDEADKCPVPLARLVRSVSTVTQQEGIKGIRFALTGVTPFFHQFVSEDPGVTRFFYKQIHLSPMMPEESDDLLEVKFAKVASEAKKLGVDLQVEPELIKRVTELSGGHPHLLQLLGSHIVENEDADPDGVISSHDLASSLSKICYDDRASVYDSLLHRLEVHTKLDSFKLLIANMAPGFPSRIFRRLARDLVSTADLEWLKENNLLSTPTSSHYGLVDEFIRARIILDEAETVTDQANRERYMIETSPSLEDEDWEPGDR